MQIDDVRTWSVLRRIVAGLSGDFTLRQDMMQECAVCLCAVEREKPGQTRSWYLRNCRFHLQHWLAAGRSLDSRKRGGANFRVQIDGVIEDAISERCNTNGDFMEEIFARDLFASLLRRLRPREQKVLRGLAAGATLREIASERGMSYPTVIRYRDKIARLVKQLERPVICQPGFCQVRRHAPSSEGLGSRRSSTSMGLGSIPGAWDGSLRGA